MHFCPMQALEGPGIGHNGGQVRRPVRIIQGFERRPRFQIAVEDKKNDD
jgi:hypothetical protein